MNTSLVILFTGMGLTSLAAICFQTRFYLAVRAFEAHLRSQGSMWSYWANLSLQIEFLFSPAVIYSEGDTPEARRLKDILVARRKESLILALPICLFLFLGTALLTIVVVILENVIT